MNKKPISYLQTDSRWGSKAYRVEGETSTIASAGCGPTAAAMLLSTMLGETITPVDTCAWSVANGFKALHQGTYYAYFEAQFKYYNLTCRRLNSQSSYGDVNHSNHARVLQMLREGYYIIALMGKGRWTSSGHFVVLWWADDKTAYILDPNSTRADRTIADLNDFFKEAKYYWYVDARDFNKEGNKVPKVYLSPAYHWFNTCTIAGCDETTHNNMYLDELEPYLKACGIDYKRGPRRTPKSNEDGTELMKQAVKESNEWGADVHYVSHTNAFDGTVRGYRPIIYPGSDGGEKLANLMIAERRKIYDQPIRLNTRDDLYETRVPYAPTYYEEHVFHDNMDDALWFHNNMRRIAEGTARAFCAYFGIAFVDPYAAKEEGNVIYRVQVGAFRVKANADAYLKKVQEAGFPDAYIVKADL